MNSLLLGAMAMASLVVALCFLRFWRDTHDRFFLLFAIASHSRVNLSSSALSR